MAVRTLVKTESSLHTDGEQPVIDTSGALETAAGGPESTGDEIRL